MNWNQPNKRKNPNMSWNLVPKKGKEKQKFWNQITSQNEDKKNTNQMAKWSQRQTKDQCHPQKITTLHIKVFPNSKEQYLQQFEPNFIKHHVESKADETQLNSSFSKGLHVTTHISNNLYRFPSFMYNRCTLTERKSDILDCEIFKNELLLNGIVILF